MTTLESAELHYENSFEREFFPGLISRTYKKEGIKYTLLFFMLAHATLISSYIPPTIAALQYEEGNPRKTLPEKLPYYSWMPFRCATSTTYLIALGYQAIPMFSYAYSIVGMDTLFMNIMNCIGMNLDIIQGAFATLRERSVEKTTGPLLTPDGLYNSQDLKIILNQEMKKVCRHLQTVYKVCEDLENIHTFLTLSQTTATLFILCSCLYLVSTTPASSKQFLAEIVYMIAMGFQLILYCWFGNEVTLKADNMPFYIWQCDWITADSEFKRAMIFTMVRAKRPLRLTAGKFAPLTLGTFIAVDHQGVLFFLHRY
ncbi:odorant receptor 94b isoform X1 [Leptinotarsa decemlineata]|uniref:odorant receptor 94b isoform X1 n=1 Tax=Leptinotarsa decemlineata TaxID=7539 RepID=UPI003D30B609